MPVKVLTAVSTGPGWVKAEGANEKRLGKIVVNPMVTAFVVLQWQPVGSSAPTIASNVFSGTVSGSVPTTIETVSVPDYEMWLYIDRATTVYVTEYLST